MNWTLKKFIAMILIVAMVFTSTGFATFAESIDDVTVVNSETTEPTSDKYYEDVLGNKHPSYAEGEIGSSESTEINDESTTVEEAEDDEYATVEEPEEGESTTTEKLEEETTTTEKSEEETLAASESASDSAGESESVEPKDTLESSESVVGSTASPTENPTNVAPVESDSIGDDTASPSDINSYIDDVEETSPIASSSEVEDGDNDEDDDGDNDGNISTVSNVEAKTFDMDIENASKSDANLFGDNPLFGSLPTHVWFGTYPQNDSTGVQKEPIKWNVRSSDGSKVYLLADKILDWKQWHTAADGTAWEQSSLHTWLNGTFKTNAFNTTQINCLKSISANTLITVPAVDELTSGYYAPAAAKTPYSGAGEGGYWFRNGRDDGRATYCDPDGQWHTTYYKTSEWGVRPSLYLDLTKVNLDPSPTVTWQLGANSFKSGSSLWNDFNMYIKGQQLPNSDNMTSRTGCTFRGWRINNSDTVYNSIPSTQTGNVTLKPVNDCAITWSGRGTTWSFKDNSTAATSYASGREFTLPLNADLNPPARKELDYWTIKRTGKADVVATKIDTTMDEAVTLEPTFKNLKYNVTFNMGDGRLNIATPSQYEGNVGLTLPTVAQVVPPVLKDFDHWIIRQVGKDDINPATQISNTTGGDVEVIAVYKNATYNITWTMNGGSFKVPSEASPSYIYGSNYPLPQRSQINGSPAGYELDYWTIKQDGKPDIVGATSISSTTYNDVEIVATYRKGQYTVTWNQGYDFKNPSIATASYVYGDSWSLPAGTAINLPPTKELDHWVIKINGAADIDPATGLTPTMYGNIEILAVYRNAAYTITWTLGDGNTWTSTAGTDNYTYGTGVSSFPQVTSGTTGKEFDYWILRQTGKQDITRVTNISTSTYGPVEMIAVYKNIDYAITWNLGAGSWNGVEGADYYTYGTALTLPTNITPPTGKTFHHWEIGGTAVTAISATDTGVKTIDAVYSNKRYNITWNLNGASTENARPTDYEYGVGFAFANLGTITPQTGRTFSHFTVNGVQATSISTTESAPVTVTVVYTDMPTHDINYDYGTGDDAWSFVGWTAPATYTEGVVLALPDASKVQATNAGKELDYFTVDGVRATSIAANKTENVTVAAVLKNKEYTITWNLGDGSWNGVEGADHYTYGTDLTLPTNITPPVGRTFDHWEIEGTTVTAISATEIGDKTIVAVYENIEYNINWELNGATVTGTTPTYTYGTAVDLPLLANITPAAGKTFDYWLVNGAKATSISATTYGDVTVTLVYVGTQVYDINWDLGSGYLSGYDRPSAYTKGVALSLPASSYVVAPSGRTFLHWTINGTQATEISATQTGVVNIKAVYSAIPTPNPTPNPTPGYVPYSGRGGRGGGGGGGGGGGSIPAGQNNLEIGSVVTIPVQNYEYIWASANDSKGAIQYFAKVLKTSTLAKALMSSSEYSQYYKDLDQNYIQIKNGIYSLQYLNQFYNYAFDFDGNMRTGIVSTTDDAKQFILDVNNGNLTQVSTIGKGKYYFYDGAGELYGVMWNQPITVNDVQYTFDANGKILTETPVASAVGLSNTSSSGNWKYDPVSNQWKFASADANGQVTYYQSGAYPIQAEDGNIYYYIFDDSGNMKTGLTEYQGKTYYLREDGPLKGAVWTGKITLNNKEYEFGENGELISA